jgi:hypothetical protein
MLAGKVKDDPLLGCVMVTVTAGGGGGGMFETTKITTALETADKPLLAVATAVKEWNPTGALLQVRK